MGPGGTGKPWARLPGHAPTPVRTLGQDAWPGGIPTHGGCPARMVSPKDGFPKRPSVNFAYDYPLSSYPLGYNAAKRLR